MNHSNRFGSLDDLRRALAFCGNTSLVTLDPHDVIETIDDYAGLFSDAGRIIGTPSADFLLEHSDLQAEYFIAGQTRVIMVRQQLSKEPEPQPEPQRLLEETEQICSIGCFDWDIRENHVRWTDGLYRIFGLEPQEFEATLEGFLERVLPEDRPAVQSTIEKAVHERGQFANVKRILHASGRHRFVESRGHVIADRDGNPIRLIGVCCDVTEREESARSNSWQISGFQLLADSASKIMAQADELDWHALLKKIGEHLECDGFTNYAVNDGELKLLHCHGFSQETQNQIRVLQVGQLPCGICAATRQMLHLSSEQMGKHPQCGGLYGMGYRSFVGVPLIVDGQLHGTLAFVSTTRTGFAKQELDFVQTVSQLIAAAQAKQFYATEIREREQRIQVLFHHTADVVLMHDQEGKFLDANLSACETLGYSHHELLQMSCGDIESEATESVDTMAAVSNGEPWSYLATYRRKDGTEFPVEVLSRNIAYQGESVVLVSARDVSRRLAMEEQTRRAEETNRMILRQANLVTWEADPKTLDFTFLSGSCEELLGVSREQWLKPGFWCDRLMTDDAVASLKQARAGKQRTECRMLHAGGYEIWVEAIYERIYDAVQNRVVALRGVLSDITVRKRLEEELRHTQKMEAIGRLAGGVAHDFNNLLTVINTHAELLTLGFKAEGYKTQKTLDSVEAIRDAADRASSLTSQLLMFGRNSIQHEQCVNLSEVIDSVKPLVQRLLGDEVQLDTDLCFALPSMKADRSHLDQVLVNLAVNARDAMPSGGTFRLTTAVKEIGENDFDSGELPAGRYVSLEVADTGLGMQDDERARAFDPFFTTKPVGQGTGLGLAVVYGVVRDCGGSISVDSAVGQGTTFRILFPASEEETDEVKEGLITSPRGSELVLLVEDEKSVREAAGSALRRHGYRVIEAHSIEQATEIANKLGSEVQLLLTDLVMPGGNGLELATSVIDCCPNVRVLCMSGYSWDLNDRKDSPHTFLQKPFTARALMSKVREVLDDTLTQN